MKRLKILLLSGIFLWMFSYSPVSASGSLEGQVFQNASSQEGLSQFQQQYEELLEQSGANELFSLVPDDAKDILNENDITSLDSSKFLNMNIFAFIKNLWSTIKSSITKPMQILLSGIGVVLLCALLNSIKSSFDNATYEKVFSLVSVICIATVIIIPIAQVITKTAQLIKQVSNFMLSFIPVYVGIITASGKPVSAISYNTALIGVIQVVSRIAASVLVPLLAIYLAFCLIGSASTQINIEGIAKAVKNIVIVTLSFLMTVFVGLLTIQGVVAAATDTVAMKIAKFGFSSFLPVVGSAISEALNSVQGCMGVIKSTLGSFGLITIIAAFLPSMIAILLIQLSLTLTGAVSDMLDTGRITSLMKAASSVLSLVLGILLVFFVLIVVSLTIMLSLSTGVN
jgi:stage III sporulation protein AE